MKRIYEPNEYRTKAIRAVLLSKVVKQNLNYWNKQIEFTTKCARSSMVDGVSNYSRALRAHGKSKISRLNTC